MANGEPPPIVPAKSVLEYSSAEGGDAISWANWKEPKDIGLHAFVGFGLLIWAPMTVAITWLAVKQWRNLLSVPAVPAALFVSCAWLGLFAISTVFARLAMRETIRVRDDVIEHSLEGLGIKRRRVVLRADVTYLSLEKYNDESVQTLNLFFQKGKSRRRVMLAYSLRPARKAEVFAWLKERLRSRGWACDFIDPD